MKNLQSRGEFDFEKLIVYQKSLEYYALIRKIQFNKTDADRIVAKQLIRAALSISLNIAEGTGRISPKDRRNFDVIARGSIFECAAITLALEKESSYSNTSQLALAYSLSVEIGKMLSTMIQD